jgi:hypothetical protein
MRVGPPQSPKKRMLLTSCGRNPTDEPQQCPKNRSHLPPATANHVWQRKLAERQTLMTTVLLRTRGNVHPKVMSCHAREQNLWTSICILCGCNASFHTKSGLYLCARSVLCTAQSAKRGSTGCFREYAALPRLSWDSSKSKCSW